MNIPSRFAAWLLCAVSFSATALDLGNIPAGEISVYVKELDSGKIVESHRADAAVNPASAMKLVTAYAAFRALGQDYRWHTDWLGDGEIKDGTLSGNLYWAGSGNPVLQQEDLAVVQQQLRNAGVRNIEGGLVLDRSLWGSVPNSPDFAADEGKSYMIPPDPNMLAYKVVWLMPERDSEGRVVVRTKPQLPEIPLDNRISIVPYAAAECSSLRRYMKAEYAVGVLRVSGRLPESCLGQEMFVNMLGAEEFAYRSFTNLWRWSGGQIADGLQTGDTPPEARLLVRHFSPPLKDMLTEMNKHSSNLIARSVYLKLGGSEDVQTALAQAETVVRRELALSGVDSSELVLENGSGLSRKERVTAEMLGQMLEKAYFSPFKEAFIRTLPIAGADGTLKDRLSAAGPSLRLKTGTLKNVRALAGYWLGEKPMAVVVIINSPNADYYLESMDKLIESLVPKQPKPSANPPEQPASAAVHNKPDML
ncbi:D-alanyl-D-alanine carboxypeptidase/D-alanyl-D-alanine endopeptidase [Neisseria animalis]|uniref:D-alanyl-D-alanine carboxypeptidase/D-alanyl-D-alanine-endopeptidase n=1 Tax=Neisseria animalis TaxID=492 RepID=A0A5P3MRQ7_NEIAN|nr:D-alanyl-D-alanine carboxypeptidase/D-alanyl-D-alanine-endopeptidase [Neisseria animalis]QEY24218.1 D-alanyl-D-alanine carboxypeptidase/D-alanyl-D-alanine-endopeptidase [Neisseria animalis]ROW32173.1 D-alanyl-D-alanine carboxypeptidase/D-alanyl-D-alanine-endopeptidase [Neisseria animalis]VEE06545.1 penicillin-binding protein 3 [Neisseria animalis]